MSEKQKQIMVSDEILKQHLMKGKEIIEKYFKDTDLNNTLLNLNVLSDILNEIKNDKSSIESGICIILYAKSYAANVKSRKIK